MFRDLQPRRSAVDECAASLRESILDGTAPPGARLPPERELAARFGVNRATVRSALARLAAAGLLDVRQGSGYSVRPWRSAGGPGLLADLIDLARRAADKRSIARDLLRVRLALAEAVLERLAAEPPGPRALAKIEASVGALEQLVDAGASPGEIAQADVAALGAIVDAADSAVLRLFVNPVTALLGELPELAVALYAEPRENVALFRALLGWLGAPNAAAVPRIIAGMRARDQATLAALAPARPRAASPTSAERAAASPKRRSRS